MIEGKKLVVVSTCTNQKRGQIANDLELRSLGGTSAESAASIWKENISKTEKLGTTPAQDTYIGSHWKETLAATKSASKEGYSPELWILSAGYGLIPATQPIVPYAAAFSSGEDSIQNLDWSQDHLSNTEKAKGWWKLLAKSFERPGLERFKGTDPSIPILFVLSPQYYRAIESELIELASGGANLLIVSAGLYRNLTSVSPIIRPYVLPFSDSFKQLDPYLNNTNVSLNSRLTNWLIDNHGDLLQGGASEVFPVLEKIAATLPEPERKTPVPMTDDEVLEYISKNYSEQLNSASKMLRQLRDVDGLSCEQRRFGKLFRKYQNHLQGNELF